MPLTTGKRDRYCVLEVATVTQNSFGEKVQSWSTFAAVWASRTIKGGDERHDARQTQATTRIVYVIDYYPGIHQPEGTKMRLVDGDATFGIRAIAEIGRGEGYEIEVSAPV